VARRPAGPSRPCRRPFALEPDLAEAWVWLVLIGLEEGHAREALVARCAALESTATPRRGWLLEGIVSLAEPYAC
jgi:hypothetical protein